MDADVPPLSPAAVEAWGLMSRLLWELRPRMVGVAAELGLTPPQMFALNVLDPQRPIPMRELAAQLHCDNSNVTGLVDRLAAQGLVERREDPHDRRVRMVAVTEAGARIRARLQAGLLEVPPAIARLSPEDQRVLCDLLRRASAKAADRPATPGAPDGRRPEALRSP